MEVYEQLCPFEASSRASLCAKCVKKAEGNPPCVVNWIRRRVELVGIRTREGYRKAA